MADIGVAVISDGQPWDYHRDVIRRVSPSLIRVRTPVGFGFTPAQLDTIITDNPNLQTIVLCTEDAIVTPKQVEQEIVGRGFYEVVKAQSGIGWVIEVGNESDRKGADIWIHRFNALQTLKTLKPLLALPNLRWSVSLPTILTETIDLLARDANGCILDHSDVHCAHLYGWYELGDGAGDKGKWNDILDYLLKTTNKNIIITEAGIDDRDTPKVEKARRYLRWAASAHPRIQGVCLWGVGDWINGPGRNPSMEIDAAMADVLGSRHTEPQQPPAPEPEPAGKVTIHSPFKAAPSISADGFITILESKGSFDSDALWEPTPRSERPNEARRIYAHITSQGHDPAVWLAILGKESSYGTNQQSVLHRGSTRSWTNARAVRDRSLVGWSLYTDPQRNSSYVKYRSVYDSVQDGIYRVDDPTYAYKDARTILEVVSIWAPSSDSNNPKAYAQTMVDWINAWQQQYPVEQEPPPMAINIIIDHFDGPNRPHMPMPNPRYITVHETANTDKGANALMHSKFLKNGGGSSGVSFHYVVDDHEARELMPPNEVAWHAGDGGNGTGNRQSIAIETCVNSDGNWPQTVENLAQLVAVLMDRHSIPLERVVQHNYWSGKNCPTNLRRSGWAELRSRIKAIADGADYQGDPEPEPLPDVIEIPETGKHIGHGFLTLWRDLEATGVQAHLRILGYPLTEEFGAHLDGEDQGFIYQIFQRAVLTWRGGNAEPWQNYVCPLPEAARVYAYAQEQGLIA